VASWADGLITAAGPRDAMRAIVDAFREGGGDGKSMFLQATVSFAPSEEEAAAAAYDEWRQCALSPVELADLRSPAEFDTACADAPMTDVLARVRASGEIERHAEWLHEDLALGFDRIYLHNVARRHQEHFIEACGMHLLPSFSRAYARDLAS
jgi:hypothetical protein